MSKYKSDIVRDLVELGSALFEVAEATRKFADRSEMLSFECTLQVLSARAHEIARAVGELDVKP